MDTGRFNQLDNFIAKYRLSLAVKYLKQNDVILDFGCGVGHYFLSSAKDKFKLGYGLDYDIGNLQKENIILQNYRFQDILPFESNSFDKIFILAVLEHIEKNQVQTLFLEFSRVLKNKGRIIITTPTPRAKALLEFLAFKLKIISTGEISDHKYYYCSKEVNALAQASGLKVIDVKLFQFSLNSLYIIEKHGG